VHNAFLVSFLLLESSRGLEGHNRSVNHYNRKLEFQQDREACMASIDRNRVLSLAQSLIRANSENPPGHEREVASILRGHLESFGLLCKVVGSSERPSLIFSTGEDLDGNLLLHGHMDTVPAGARESWEFEPFGAELVGDRLYGRGACDMKGPLAALAETMILHSEEKHSKPLIMLATSDEETTCGGAEEVVKSGLLDSIKFGVCAEPTSLNILVGEKGLLWLRIVAQGKSAHGSTPELGENAIELCMSALETLLREHYSFEQNEQLGVPTINLGRIEGGSKINIVPEDCEAEIDMRLVMGQDSKEIVGRMGSLLTQQGLEDRVRIETIRSKPTVLTPKDSEIVAATQEAVERVTGAKPSLGTATFGTDCSVLQPKAGIMNVICGPGSIKMAHQPDEHIDVNQLFEAIEVYRAIAKWFAGQ